MNASVPTPPHRTRTLWLCGILHGFTHTYQVALLPLYLQIQRDFRLADIGQATLLVTGMMAGYFLPSFFMGQLADRFSRTRLLAWGLLINAVGFVAMALAPNYPLALASALVAGVGGSFFHPAATALVAQLYPLNTGRALGLFGVGASLGFFVGPLYAGWRAETSGWRAPVLELGVAGVVMALAFWWLADPDRRERRAPDHVPEKMFPAASLWFVFLVACLAFSLRDFTGFSMGTLGSLFFQQAHGFGIQQTGLYLSGIFIASIISNPVLGQLSDSGRQRWAGFVLVMAAIVIAAFPHLPRPLLLPALLVYGFFFMSSYPIVEAALMQAVPAAVRGRVFGFFITIGGFVGNLSHWLIGKWVENLGPAASQVPSFYRIYAVLAMFLLISLIGLPCLHFIRRREGLQKSDAVPVPAT